MAPIVKENQDYNISISDFICATEVGELRLNNSELHFIKEIL